MKLVKTAYGKQTLRISRPEWEELGKTAGWKVAQSEMITIPITMLQGWALDLSQGDTRPRFEIEQLLESKGHLLRNPTT